MPTPDPPQNENQIPLAPAHLVQYLRTYLWNHAKHRRDFYDPHNDHAARMVDKEANAIANLIWREAFAQGAHFGISHATRPSYLIVTEEQQQQLLARMADKDAEGLADTEQKEKSNG